MRPALPAPDYYGGSAPPAPFGGRCAYPQTAGRVPAPGEPAAGGSHVHCDPLSGLGARLCPGGLATPTPQSFSVASRTANVRASRKFPPQRQAAGRTAPGPYPPGLSRCQGQGRNNAVPLVLLSAALAGPAPSG